MILFLISFVLQLSYFKVQKISNISHSEELEIIFQLDRHLVYSIFIQKVMCLFCGVYQKKKK